MAKITASFVLDDTDLEIIKDLAATGDFSDSAALRLIIREWSRSNDGRNLRTYTGPATAIIAGNDLAGNTEPGSDPLPGA